MRVKTAPVIKAGPEDGLEEGEFLAYASVFGNVDSYGDIVQPGAFDGSLKEWEDAPGVLPVLFGHNMSDPDYNIGHVISAVEDEKGLLVRARLDLEAPKGVTVHRLLKEGRVSQMSFAYDVIRSAPGKGPDGEDALELHELKLYEVSVVPIGANQETSVLAVKAALASLAGGEKVGRVLAAKHLDGLRAARDSITEVIKAAEVDDESKAGPGKAGVKDEGPAGVKSAGVRLRPSALALAGIAAEIEAV